MKTDLILVYLMLWVIMISSCSGPTRHDIRLVADRVADDVQAIKLACVR